MWLLIESFSLDRAVYFLPSREISLRSVSLLFSLSLLSPALLRPFFSLVSRRCECTPGYPRHGLPKLLKLALGCCCDCKIMLVFMNRFSKDVDQWPSLIYERSILFSLIQTIREIFVFLNEIRREYVSRVFF